MDSYLLTSNHSYTYAVRLVYQRILIFFSQDYFWKNPWPVFMRYCYQSGVNVILKRYCLHLLLSWSVVNYCFCLKLAMYEAISLQC
jgi:hypothetical protein